MRLHKFAENITKQISIIKNSCNMSKLCPFGRCKFQLHIYGEYVMDHSDISDIWMSDSNIHYNGVIMGAIASQITSLTIVYSTIYSDADQRKHQSSASLAFVWWIHRGPVNSPHKWPVTRKMFPFDDVIIFDVWTSERSSRVNESYIAETS